MARSSLLWYKQPASEWNEALPIGNGRLGCMVHGRTDTELLCLNEDSVWYGGPQDRLSRSAQANLPHLRELIREGNHKEAEKVVKRAFLTTPSAQRHYEPLGTVKIDFGHDKVTDYRRELDLDNGIHTTKYFQNGMQVETSAMASFPDNVIVMSVKFSKLSEFVISVSRLSEKEYESNEYLDSVQAADNQIVMFASAGGNGVRACCVLRVNVDAEGTIEAIGGSLIVNAKEAFIAISARTTFRHGDFGTLALSDVSKALDRKLSSIRQDHLQDYRSLYNSMVLHLGSPIADSVGKITTGERLNRSPTPSLTALYTRYGRYLLIASSRGTGSERDLPTNLQGIWNPSFAPAWGSKFTININIQMNYWPCLPSGLSACMEPLFSLLRAMSAEHKGQRTAKDMYGARGWCCHHNTDLWADTDPAERWMPAALWPLGGAWLCSFIWEHYMFTLDRSMLSRNWDILKGAAEFCLDWLVEEEIDGKKYRMTNPSLSPENTFVDANGENKVFCRGSTADMEIISNLFEAFTGACQALSRENNLLTEIEEARLAFPPRTICPSAGTIQEWGLINCKEAEPGHRHVSHLLGLYPFSSITPTATPSLASAAARTLESRLRHGSGHTGWSRAHLICLYARLHDADAVKEQIQRLISESTLPNMLDTHPPFQIDGNFGGAAGIIETLVQSHEVFGDRRVIRLLPACPKTWKDGEIRGVRVRGGWSVAFRWEHGKIVDFIEIRDVAVSASTFIIRKGVLILPCGREVEFEGAGPYSIDA